ncbi:YncE family protein [Monashia sp. NPDC004114]
MTGSGSVVERLDTSGLPVRQVKPLAVVKTGFDFVTRLSVAGDMVWASAAEGLAVMDPKTNRAVRISSLPAQTSYGHGRVLVTNSFGRSVVARYDPASHKQLWEVHEEAPSGVAIQGDRLWISNYTKGTVTIADAATGKTVGTVKVSAPSGTGPSQPLLVGDKVWVRDYSTHEIIAIDVKTRAVGPRVKVPASMKLCVKAMAASGSVLWVPDCTTLLARIDTRTGTASVVDLGAEPGMPLVTGKGIWVPLRNRFIHFSGAARPDRAVEVWGADYVFEAASGGGALWANEGHGTLARLPSPDQW